jgi:flagellar basal-body rod protein FlgB
LFGEIANSGSGPALEAALRFASQRQKLILHNIANITTPNFVQSDVSVPKFQEMLRGAIDKRNAGGGLGELKLTGNDEVEPGPRAGSSDFTLAPKTPHGGILFHDRNNRSTELLMQDLVENGTMYRVCADLLKSRTDLMRTAISERL